MLQCAHVRGMRLKGIPSCDNTCVFIECRTLSVIKRRGLGALIAVKKHGANEYKLGLCIATDLYSMAYLEWNGPYHALDNLYGVRKKTTEWNSISTYLSNEIITLRWKNTTSRTTTKAPKPCIDMPEIHFLNMVKASETQRNCLSSIRIDTIDSLDGCYSYSSNGPDILLDTHMIPNSIRLRAAMELGPNLQSIKPPNQHQLNNKKKPKRKANKAKQGDFLLIAQKGLKTTMKGGQNIKIGSKVIRETESATIDVPFLCSQPIGKKMAKVQKSKIMSLINKAHDGYGLTPRQFDNLLLDLADAVTDNYSVIDYRNQEALWIVSVDVDDFSLHNKWYEEKSQYLGEGNTHVLVKNCDRYDLLHSLGRKAHVLCAAGDLLPEELREYPREVIDALLEIYGPKGSFGDRKCSVRLGYNTYQGPRNSRATRENPVSGKQSLAEVDYWTEAYCNVHAIVALNPFVNLISNEVAKIGRMLHHEHAKLLEKSTNLPASCKQDSICANFILTGGILDEILSFCNSTHVDVKDKAARTLQKLFRRQVAEHLEFHKKKKQRTSNGPSEADSALKRIESPINLSNQGASYLHSWDERFNGYDAFTTCGYGDVGRSKLPAGTIIYQFFNMPGLGVAARLGPGVVHSFFAKQFAHSTALTVGVANGKVFLKHPDYCVFAWGLGNVLDDCIAKRTRGAKARRAAKAKSRRDTCNK